MSGINHYGRYNYGRLAGLARLSAVIAAGLAAVVAAGLAAVIAAGLAAVVAAGLAAVVAAGLAAVIAGAVVIPAGETAGEAAVVTAGLLPGLARLLPPAGKRPRIVLFLKEFLNAVVNIRQLNNPVA